MAKAGTYDLNESAKNPDHHVISLPFPADEVFMTQLRELPQVEAVIYPGVSIIVFQSKPSIDATELFAELTPLIDDLTDRYMSSPYSIPLYFFLLEPPRTPKYAAYGDTPTLSSADLRFVVPRWYDRYLAQMKTFFKNLLRTR